MRSERQQSDHDPAELSDGQLDEVIGGRDLGWAENFARPRPPKPPPPFPFPFPPKPRPPGPRPPIV
jgi:hypothetical protein